MNQINCSNSLSNSSPAKDQIKLIKCHCSIRRVARKRLYPTTNTFGELQKVILTSRFYLNKKQLGVFAKSQDIK